MNAPHRDAGFFTESLASRDPEIVRRRSRDELGRQRDEIELIASENIVSRAVMEAQGSVMTNKYAEGYPGKRYYGGCQFVDVAETLAIERAKQLFGVAFANVQPNSGSQANQGVFLALIKPGDTILGMSLDAGGHLTHGAEPEPVGQVVQRGAVRRAAAGPAARLRPDRARWRRSTSPKLIIAGGSAIPRIIDFARMRGDRRQGGRLSAGRHGAFRGPGGGGRCTPRPFPHAHVATTTTHKTLRGPRGGMILTNDEEIAKKVNSAIFPGIQGGPLMHVIAAKAVAFGEALRPEFKTYQAQVVTQRAGAGGSADEGRARHRHGRHRHPPDAGGPAPQGREGQRDRKGAGARAHHLQQERHPVRHREADDHQRHPPWHARRHDARLRRGRVPPDRRLDRRGGRRACREWRGRQRRGRGQA